MSSDFFVTYLPDRSDDFLRHQPAPLLAQPGNPPGSVGREATKTQEASYSGTGSAGWQEMNIVDSE